MFGEYLGKLDGKPVTKTIPDTFKSIQLNELASVESFYVNLFASKMEGWLEVLNVCMDPGRTGRTYHISQWMSGRLESVESVESQFEMCAGRLLCSVIWLYGRTD